MSMITAHNIFDFGCIFLANFHSGCIFVQIFILAAYLCKFDSGCIFWQNSIQSAYLCNFSFKLSFQTNESKFENTNFGSHALSMIQTLNFAFFVFAGKCVFNTHKLGPYSLKLSSKYLAGSKQHSRLSQAKVLGNFSYSQKCSCRNLA